MGNCAWLADREISTTSKKSEPQPINTQETRTKKVEKKLSDASFNGSREGRTLDLGLTYEILGPRSNQLSHGTVDSGCGIGG